MNILYLKYAVEVAKTGSINKAAESLYMAQPNLSRAIKELEASLGVTLFDRTTKGMTPTPEGEKLLQYATGILRQVDEVEALFSQSQSGKLRCSIAVPRAAYLAQFIANYSRLLGPEQKAELFYQETSALGAIQPVLRGDYRLGVIRYAAHHDQYYQEMLAEKGLCLSPVATLQYTLVMSRRHPLAGRQTLTSRDLQPFLEVAFADPEIPSLPLAQVQKQALPEEPERRIFVFERASQLELLAENPDAFVWSAPMPQTLLERYALVQKPCQDASKHCLDVLIYRKDTRLSQWETAFITALCASAE